MLRTALLLLAAFFCTSPAVAAWGENWGEMVWGSSAPPTAVPMTVWPGLFLLLTVLLVTALWKMKRIPRQVGLTLSLFLLVPVMIAPHITTWNGLTWYEFINGEVADAGEVNQNFTALATALDVTVPNSFANSGIADANQVNSNFDVLRAAVEQFTTDAAAATAATDTAFNNGVASVDVSANDHQVCETAGGSWIDPMDGSPAFCLPADVHANYQSVCHAAGGIWDAGTSTCSQAPAVLGTYGAPLEIALEDIVPVSPWTSAGSVRFNLEVQVGVDAESSVIPLPAGQSNVLIQVESPSDVDLHLTHLLTSETVIGWPTGLLNGPELEVIGYRDLTVTYSGYRGRDGMQGNEFFAMRGILAEPYQVKAVAYQDAHLNDQHVTVTVTYSWGLSTAELCDAEGLTPCL